MKTITELLSEGTKALLGADIDNARNEARWLLESVLGMSAGEILLSGEKQISEKCQAEFLEGISQRISGRPIQYIIGRWEFYGREFEVGEGALIPRPETELLCETALRIIKDKAEPAVIDLCSGTGCIGITVMKEHPGARVTFVEKYDAAVGILKKNLILHGISGDAIFKADIFDLKKMDFPGADLIVSNPPYIPSGEIPALQSEVLCEPETALDGGEDGLDFYRAVKKISELNSNCPVAVECGENQSKEIINIFGGGHCVKDFAGVERVVVYP
ncbi:MAG: peptide chain release factor N(5)-glutamine methyltransferase [Clostridia bacterium]|nr:peptide chain release factor N(5)-glutamine methyltransferase [Clostridia bacterium]